MMSSTLENFVSPAQKKDPFRWVIAVSCAILTAVAFGICFSYGIFFTSLQTEFGWSSTYASIIFAVYMLLAAICSIGGSKLAGMYSPRLIILLMGIVSGLSLTLTSLVESGWQLYFSLSLMLAVGTGAMFVIVKTIIAGWFPGQKGIALAIIGTGAGVGVAAIAPLSAKLISSYDWKDAYLILGIIAWLFIMPHALILRKPPVTSVHEPKQEDWPKRAYVMVYVMWFCYALCLSMIACHIVPDAMGMDMSLVKSSLIISIMSWAMVVSGFMTGFASDEVSHKTAGIIFALVLAIVMFWLVDAEEAWEFYLFALVFGMAFGGIVPVLFVFTGELNDKRSKNVIIPIIWGAGAFLGPYITGVVFDEMESYKFAFFLGAWFMALAAFCIWNLPGNEKVEASENLAVTSIPDDTVSV